MAPFFKASNNIPQIEAYAQLVSESFEPRLAPPPPPPPPRTSSFPVVGWLKRWLPKQTQAGETEFDLLPNTREGRESTWHAKRKPLPPSSVVTTLGDFREHGGSGDIPCVNEQGDSSSPKSTGNASSPRKPTCSLNLACYRKGGNGFTIRQIRVVATSKCESISVYKFLCHEHPELIRTDEELFRAFREVYLHQMCGSWRRWFSLKTLRNLRLLSWTPTTRPVPVELEEYTMQEVLYAYNHPADFRDDTQWIEWIYRLGQPDKRHTIEFVEGWDGARIAIAGSIPCIASTLVGVIWSAMGGDAQTAFTVAGFILTRATVLLALLAVISSIESWCLINGGFHGIATRMREM